MAKPSAFYLPQVFFGKVGEITICKAGGGKVGFHLGAQVVIALVGVGAIGDGNAHLKQLTEKFRILIPEFFGSLWAAEEVRIALYEFAVFLKRCA